MTRGKLDIRWDNPPGLDSGLEVRLTARGRSFVTKVSADGFLTLAEAAAALGRDFSTVYRWAELGKLETTVVRGRRMVPVSILKEKLGFIKGARRMRRTRETLEQENASLMSEIESIRARLDEILAREAIRGRPVADEEEEEDEEDDLDDEAEDEDEEDDDEEEEYDDDDEER